MVAKKVRHFIHERHDPGILNACSSAEAWAIRSLIRFGSSSSSSKCSQRLFVRPRHYPRILFHNISLLALCVCLHTPLTWGGAQVYCMLLCLSCVPPSRQDYSYFWDPCSNTLPDGNTLLDWKSSLCWCETCIQKQVYQKQVPAPAQQSQLATCLLSFQVGSLPT